MPKRLFPNLRSTDYTPKEWSIIKAVELREGEFFTRGEGYDWMISNEEFRDARNIPDDTGLKNSPTPNKKEECFLTLAWRHYGDPAPMELLTPEGWKPAVTHAVGDGETPYCVYVTRMFRDLDEGIAWLEAQPILCP